MCIRDRHKTLIEKLKHIKIEPLHIPKGGGFIPTSDAFKTTIDNKKDD